MRTMPGGILEAVILNISKALPIAVRRQLPAGASCYRASAAASWSMLVATSSAPTSRRRSA